MAAQALLAALPTLDEQLSRTGPNESLRCGREAPAQVGLTLRLSHTGRGFRVISVSSESHRSVTRGALFYAFEDGLTLNGPSPPSPFERYSIAKAANVLFTVELQRRIDEAASNTYHRDGTSTHV